MRSIKRRNLSKRTSLCIPLDGNIMRGCISDLSDEEHQNYTVDESITLCTNDGCNNEKVHIHIDIDADTEFSANLSDNSIETGSTTENTKPNTNSSLKITTNTLLTSLLIILLAYIY